MLVSSLRQALKGRAGAPFQARGIQSFYQAQVTSKGGRDEGEIKSSDGNLILKTSLPTGLGGKGEALNTTNPEQLFAAGYSACFLSAMIAAADKTSKKLPGSISVTGIVDIGKAEKGEGFGLEVELQIRIPGFSPQDIEKVTSEAHKLCPYSNATRGNLDVKINTITD